MSTMLYVYAKGTRVEVQALTSTSRLCPLLAAHLDQSRAASRKSEQLFVSGEHGAGADQIARQTLICK